MTDSNSVELAHNLHTKLVGVIAVSKKSFVLMGKLLYELYNEDNYMSAIGDGIDTWNAYLSQPEIGLSKQEADRLMQIYENFVLWLGVPEDELETVPIKNLHYLLPIAKQEEDADYVRGLVDEAKELSQRDFRERVHDIRHGENSPRTYEYMLMKKCVETGSMQKVHGIDSETIVGTFNLDVT